jgi:hypothetical protein
LYENTLDSEKKLNKEEINFVSLKMIPEIEKILNQVKKEKTISNKSINKFVINEQKITEYIRISGDKSYSFLIENNSPEEYVVENLVIFFQDDEYVSYITKWIPSDGKPFYNLKNFKGELQYLDLNDKLIHSVKIGDKKTSKSNQTSKTLEQYAFTFGCWDYVIADYGNGAFILSSNNHCGDNGGGTSSGGTSSGGTSTGGTSTGGTSTGGIGGSTSTTSGGGGGGYTGTGTTTFVPNIPTEDVVEAKMYKTFLTSLKPEQLNFLGYYTNVNKEIFDYLAEHNFASANKIVAKKMIHAAFITNYLGSSATTDFINWGSDYLIKNPDVTWDQFENWFMGTPEGQDGEYDAAFWENPNLTFQQQNLPTYKDYEKNMARFPDGNLMTGADNVYGLVGGDVLKARNLDKKRTENTCALKVSIALNRTGVVIPNIPNITIEGGGTEFKGKFFFLNARELNYWMRKTFGTKTGIGNTPINPNHLTFNATDGGPNGEMFPNKLKNILGLYSMITTEQYRKNGGTSGHADLSFTDSKGMGNCRYGCFFNLPIERIDIWILN